MNWYGGWWHMGGMWLGWLLVLALVIGVVWLVARAARGSAGRQDTPAIPESPEQIVKRRYAQGEIDREEYERRLADLRR